MALYIQKNVNLFEITSKQSQSGKPYVTCNAVFYSKSKDEHGEFTIDDDPFKVSCIAFGKNAEFLSSLQNGKGFVTLKGKLSSVKYEKDGKTRYTNKLDIISVSEFVSQRASAADIQYEQDIDESDIPF